MLQNKRQAKGWGGGRGSGSLLSIHKRVDYVSHIDFHIFSLEIEISDGEINQKYKTKSASKRLLGMFK